MADWNLPTLASYEVDVQSQLKSRDESLAKMFDGTTDSNIPTGSIQLLTANLVGTFRKYSGTNWDIIKISDSSLPISSTEIKGIVELATAAETITGTDSARAVTPAGLAAKTATDLRMGIVELATAAETITGTDSARAVTPAGLAAKTATTTRHGIVKLNDTLYSTSSDEALTARQGGILQDQIDVIDNEITPQDTEWLDLTSYSPLITSGSIRIVKTGVHMQTVTVITTSIQYNASYGAVIISGVIPSWADLTGRVVRNVSAIDGPSQTLYQIQVQGRDLVITPYGQDLIVKNITSVPPMTITYVINYG